MDLEKINVDGIKDPETKKVIKQLIDAIFVMNKDIQRTLNNLSSQNVKTLDFNVTKVKNVEKPLKNYATKNYVTTEILKYLG